MNSNRRLRSSTWRWLRRKLRNGFWYPYFESAISWAYSTLSIGYRFKEGFSLYGDVPAGAPELYQFTILSCGALWLLVVANPIHELLTHQVVRYLGIALALYFPTEFFLFSLDWVFAATRGLRSARRSLASFVLGTVEVAGYFTIAFTLAGCNLPGFHVGQEFVANLFSLLRLQLVNAGGRGLCSAMSHYQLVIALWIAAIVIASLVGAAVRSEREG